MLPHLSFSAVYPRRPDYVILTFRASSTFSTATGLARTAMTAPPWHSTITKAGWWKTPNPVALDAMPFFVTIWYSGCDTLEAASTTRHVAYVASGRGSQDYRGTTKKLPRSRCSI